jgi:NAD-dependent DNA ligase
MRQDMRFGVIRDKHTPSSDLYELDGDYCPSCHLPTETGEDVLRRYCTNKKCNAMVKEDV